MYTSGVSSYNLKYQHVVHLRYQCPKVLLTMTTMHLGLIIALSFIRWKQIAWGHQSSIYFVHLVYKVHCQYYRNNHKYRIHGDYDQFHCWLHSGYEYVSPHIVHRIVKKSHDSYNLVQAWRMNLCFINCSSTGYMSQKHHDVMNTFSPIHIAVPLTFYHWDTLTWDIDRGLPVTKLSTLLRLKPAFSRMHKNNHITI